MTGLKTMARGWALAGALLVLPIAGMAQEAPSLAASAKTVQTTTTVQTAPAPVPAAHAPAVSVQVDAPAVSAPSAPIRTSRTSESSSSVEQRTIPIASPAPADNTANVVIISVAATAIGLMGIFAFSRTR